MNRRCNESGIAIIKYFEGLRLKAYRCPSGVWTIGYGHTAGVHRGQTLASEKQATELLMGDLATAEEAVEKLVSVPLCPDAFSALVSFVFNVGRGAFEKSTLLYKLNYGAKLEVPAELQRWIHGGGGVVLPGLVRRRLAESALWLGHFDLLSLK